MIQSNIQSVKHFRDINVIGFHHTLQCGGRIRRGVAEHCAKKPVTTMLTYPWKCTVLHCNHLGNTWKPLVLMTRHFDYCPRASEGDNQSVRSSAPVVSRCFPGGYNVKLYISRGRLAWWLLAVLHSGGSSDLEIINGRSSVTRVRISSSFLKRILDFFSYTFANGIHQKIPRGAAKGLRKFKILFAYLQIFISVRTRNEWEKCWYSNTLFLWLYLLCGEFSPFISVCFIPSGKAETAWNETFAQHF